MPKTPADKTGDNKSKAIANCLPGKQGGGATALQFQDNRPETVAQRKIQAMADNYSSAVIQLYRLQQVDYQSNEAKHVLSEREKTKNFDSHANMGSLVDNQGPNVTPSGGGIYHAEVLLIGSAAQKLGCDSNNPAVLFSFYKEQKKVRGDAVLYTERKPCTNGEAFEGGCDAGLNQALDDGDTVCWSFNSNDETKKAVEAYGLLIYEIELSRATDYVHESFDSIIRDATKKLNEKHTHQISDVEVLVDHRMINAAMKEIEELELKMRDKFSTYEEALDLAANFNYMVSEIISSSVEY